MNAPKISVIMPTYNVKKYFSLCLESVLNSSLKDIEVIVVDDGSTDGCSQIIDDFAAKDPRVVPIHKENGGYGKALNTGIEAAKGEYISIIETDDTIDSKMLENLYNAAIESGVDCVKGTFYSCPDADKRIKHNFFKSLPIGEVFNLEEHPEILMLAPSIWSAIYKKQFLNEQNIRCVETPGASYQDLPFAYEVYSKAKSLLLLDEPLYFYRCEEGQNSSTIRSDRKLFVVVEQIQRTINLLMENNAWSYSKEAMYKHIYNTALLFIGNAHSDLKKELFCEFCKFFKTVKDENITYEYFNKAEKIAAKEMEECNYSLFVGANVLNFMRRHPLFFFRTDFWAMLGAYKI